MAVDRAWSRKYAGRAVTTEAKLDPTLSLEVVKLLLQAVFADHEVAAEEAEALHDYAVRAGVSAAELETLDLCLAGQRPLVPPNLGLLKSHRVEVLRAVRKLLASDQRMHEEEEALLDQVARLLD
jgi:uncharacterized tellurite resistance protein B-like protein